MSRVWKIVLLVVAVLVLAVVGLRVIGGGKDKAGKPAAGARQGGEDPDAGPVPVTVVEATHQDVGGLDRHLEGRREGLEGSPVGQSVQCRQQ